MLERELSVDSAAGDHRSRRLWEYGLGGYRSRGLQKAVLERESFQAIQQQEAVEVGGYGVWKRMCWSESFRCIQEHGAIEEGRYRSRGLEKSALERELREIQQQEAI